MNIVRFQYKGNPTYGIWEGEDITVAQGHPLAALTPTSEKAPFSGAELMAPIDPPNIYCIGLNYGRHAKEGGMEPPKNPLIFLKTTTAVTGPGKPILIPRMLPQSIDYEAELCIVIGKKGKNIAEENALDYVLGYTCANDVSCRDAQFGDKQWSRGKTFDTFCPLGPVLVTDIDPFHLSISLRLNGQTMQNSNTADMIFDCRKLISYVSQVATLLPGTIILTGTPEGVGFARKPPVFMKPGDVVEVEIEKIGILKNPVAAE